VAAYGEGSLGETALAESSIRILLDEIGMALAAARNAHQANDTVEFIRQVELLYNKIREVRRGAPEKPIEARTFMTVGRYAAQHGVDAAIAYFSEPRPPVKKLTPRTVLEYVRLYNKNS
jgi:hypothetical protein